MSHEYYCIKHEYPEGLLLLNNVMQICAMCVSCEHCVAAAEWSGTDFLPLKLFKRAA